MKLYTLLKGLAVRSENKHKEYKIELKKLWTYSICAAVPWFFAAFFMLIMGFGIHFRFLPVWNDEIFWHSQIAAMVSEGMPLGYFGYNGTHANIGTFGPWGWATLVPYAVFGKIFGWNATSMPIANLTFLSLAILIFFYLAQPRKQKIKFVAFAYCAMTVVSLYSVTSMSESLRYALAIIMAGIIIKLWEERGGNCFRYIITPAFIFYSVNVYLILSVFIPLYVFCVWKDKKLPVKVLLSFIITGAMAAVSYVIFSNFSAPYTESLLSQILFELKSDFYQGMSYAVINLFKNLQTLNLPELMRISTEAYGFLIWFFLIYILFTAGLVFHIYKKIKNAEEFTICAMAVYTLIALVFGYCLLYTGSAWTLCRGINTALCFAVFLLTVKEDSFVIKFFLVLSIFSSISVFNYSYALYGERAADSTELDSIYEERKIIEEVMGDIEAKDNKWENTIAHYGSITRNYLALPTGYGYNYMINEGVNKNAKWVIIGKDDGEEKAAVLEKGLLSAEHVKLYEDEKFIVLKNKLYD